MQIGQVRESWSQPIAIKPLRESKHWFVCFRLSDNPALLRAVKRCDTWRCIFILDPWFAGSSNQGVNKWRFVLVLDPERWNI